MKNPTHYDVAILGGGLAGATLARQLQFVEPPLRIAVIEKHTFPAPDAAFKVGESSVELAANYLEHTLKLKDYLGKHHLLKAGLRFFYPAGDNSDITRRSEFGVSLLPPAASYQIDRGAFENALWEKNMAAGIDGFAGCAVRDVSFGRSSHTVTYAANGSTHELDARWVVDATGRAGFLRRKLKLQRDARHNASAVWFRIDALIAIDTWSRRADWAGRVRMGLRRLSTNHFMGPGYWVWFIPLPGRRTSVGIVFDDSFHDIRTMNTTEKAMAWLETHEPQCAAFISRKIDKIMDFRVITGYSHSSRQVFSKDRWALTGEAGVFADPFYSPGSDFIAMGNTLITRMIIDDRQGESIALKAKAFQDLYMGMYDGFMKLYQDQYRIMGNGPLMTLKIGWDWAVYWGVYTLLFMHAKYDDLRYMRSVMDVIRNSRLINDQMQRLINTWDRHGNANVERRFVPFKDISFLRHLVLGLDERLDDVRLTAKLRENYDLLCLLADEIVDLAGPEVRAEVKWPAKFKPPADTGFNNVNLNRDVRILSMGVFGEAVGEDTLAEDLTELEKKLVSHTIKQLKRYEQRGEMP